MKRLCLAPRCPNDATYRGYCRTHAAKRNRETSPNASFYASAKWRHTRNHVLFEQPLCECGEIATDVHHKVDLSEGGDRWARDNLVAMCHACHSRLTRKAMA